MGRLAFQNCRSTHCRPLIARPRVGRAILTKLLNEGPLLPPAVWPHWQGVVFYKSENTLSDGHSYSKHYGLAA